MDAPPAKDDAPSTTSAKANDRQGKGVSKVDWNFFKPRIRQLYLDEGKTLSQVAEELFKMHAFKPTKKQLLYKMKAWGFEKNVKKGERGEILDRVSESELRGRDASVLLNGRRLDKSKLDRWRRQERHEADGPSTRTWESRDSSRGSGHALSFQDSHLPHPSTKLTNKRIIKVPRTLAAMNLQKTFEAFLPRVTDHDLDGIPRQFSMRDTGDFQSESVRPEWIHRKRVESHPGPGLSSQAGKALVPMAHDLDVDYIPIDVTSVDIIGSPRLTGLIRTLGAMESEDMPVLDLRSQTTQDLDESKFTDSSPANGTLVSEGEKTLPHLPQSNHSASESLNPARAAQVFEVLETWTQPCLHHKDYAFPTLRSRTYDFTTFRTPNSPIQVKRSESECDGKFKELGKLQPTEIISLAEDVGGIAQDYYNSNNFITAEVWFRRAVLVKAKMAWYEPEQTMWACVRILDCMLRQDQYEQVQKLHQDLHLALENTLGSQHPVTIGSVELKASLLGAIGLAAEEEKVLRQVLQARMETLGMRHPATVVALENLGYSLARLKSNVKAQHLLQSAVRLRVEKLEASKVLGQNESDIVKTMSSLARDLGTNIKDEANNTVFENARKLLGTVTEPKMVTESGHRYYKARFCQLRGRMQEAEDILRELLHSNGIYYRQMPPTLKADVMDMLADILSTTGRQAEAIEWLERLHDLDLETFGFIHSYTLSSCKKLAFTYAKQREYDRASRVLSKTERKIKEEFIGYSRRDQEQSHDCRQQISGWLKKIEEMMIVAETIEFSPPADTGSQEGIYLTEVPIASFTCHDTLPEVLYDRCFS